MGRKVLNGIMLTLIAVCPLAFAHSASPQEDRSGKSATLSAERPSRPDYRVEYAVREFDEGKRINTRNYKVLAQMGEESKVRVGSRVPYVTGGFVQNGPAGAAGPATMVQYQDVGISIDCLVKEERDSAVLLITRFESSNLAQEARNVGAGIANPVFRRVNVEGTSVVPLGKPTVIDVVDDVASTHQYEIEVTVTKVK